MDIKELITALVNDVKSENFMLQVVFNRHITQIEILKSQGFTYKRIMDLLNNEIDNTIQKSHFSNLIYRAKQKIKHIDQTLVNTPKKEVLQGENQKHTDEIIGSETNARELKQSLEEWRLKTNIDIPETLAFRLEKNDLNTDDVCKLQFRAVSKISRYLTQIEHKKNKDL